MARDTGGDETGKAPRCPACGKASYWSRGAAERAIRDLQMWSKARRDRGRLHAYFCDKGKRFHVGHTE